MRTRSSSLAAFVFAVATVAAAQESDFFEQKSNYFQNETLEGASKHAEALTETPATVTVIGKEEIELYGFRTVADVLNFASIGYFTHNDRRYDFGGGRGLFLFEDYNTRLLVMLNGHPLNEPWNNFAGLGREMLVPLELAERIEIIYGPSSLLYGGYSLYGIINVVTQTGGSLAGGRVRASAGNFGTYETNVSWGASGVTEDSTEWNILASGGYYSSRGEDLTLPLTEVEYIAGRDGSNVYGGPQSGTDFERAPYGFLYAKRGEFSLMTRVGSRTKGAPLAPYETVYGSTDERVRDEKSFIEARWDRRIKPGITFSARAFHDWYSYEEYDPYLDSETYPGQDGYQFVLLGDDTDTGGELRLSAQRGAHLLTGGVEYRTRRIDQESFNRFDDGERAPDSEIGKSTSGNLLVLYLQEEWRPLERWTFIAGGNFADTEPGGQKAQPRVATIFKPMPSLAIKALYGRGFRPPSVYEAGYADFIDFIDNPELESEEIASAELSAIWTPTPSVSLQAYAFDSTLEGLIRATEITDVGDVQGGVLPPSGDPEELIGLTQYQSAGDVDSHGFGLGARARHQRFRGYLNIAYADARFTPRSGDGFDLPASSNWLGSAGLAWDSGTVAASVSGRYVGTQSLDPDRGVSGSAGSFVEMNTRMLWRTRIVYPVTLFADVRNLFDSDGELAAIPAYTPDRVPIEGRRITIGAEVRF